MCRRLYFYLFVILLSSLALWTTPVAAQTWIGTVNIVATPGSATLTWNTAVPSDTQVKYGTGSSYGKRTPLNAAMVSTHTATLTGLSANVQYHFRVLGQDASGVLVTGLDYIFTTPAGPISVSISPSTATVASGANQQFTATVNNTSNSGVTWSATDGSISTSGLFTAPTVTSDKVVTITAASVADPSKSASATVTVKAPAPVLAVNPRSLTFSAQQGGSNPASAAVTLSNTGGGTLNYSVATDAAWIAATPSSGAAPSTLQIAASVAGLVPGTYTGHVTVTAPGATGSPANIDVTLTVTAPPVQHSVALQWNASTSSGVVGYNAYRGTNTGGPYALLASAITALQYVDLSVQSGRTYYYVVTAMSDQAQESVDSNEAKATVP
jgi:hypothetical protein